MYHKLTISQTVILAGEHNQQNNHVITVQNRSLLAHFNTQFISRSLTELGNNVIVK